jgi:SAM-dependent methyltransferase
MRHLLLRLLDVSGRTFDRLSRTCIYASAALTPVADLRSAVARSWRGFYVDDARIASGLMPWEQGFADTWVNDGDRLLVVGCGSGRDVLPFVTRGCQVVGIDPAAPAVAAAARALAARGLHADLRVGFFEDVTLAGPFDAVWLSWFMYGYVPDRRRRVALLRQASSLLAPGGRIVMSVEDPTEARVHRLWRIGRILGRLTGADWEIASGDDLARIPGTTGLNYRHLFAPGEVEAEVADAGLRIVARQTDLTMLVLQNFPSIPAEACDR